MSVYGYTHAPIGNNDFQAQHFAILSFVSNNRLGQVHFCNEVPDQLHGAKPILSGMIQTLQREEILIVSDFLKLGNSTDEVLGVLSALSRIGVKLYAVDSGFRLEDNMDAQVISMAYSLVSRIEQELLGNEKSAAVRQKPTKDEDRDVKPVSDADGHVSSDAGLRLALENPSRWSSRT